MSGPILGVSVLVRQDDRVLLVRRGRPPFVGTWALPGGKVNAGETLAAAAAREVLEETGIAVDNLHQIDVAEIIERDADGRATSHDVVIVFSGEAGSGTPAAGDDAAEARWVTKSDAAVMDLTADTRRVLTKRL